MLADICIPCVGPWDQVELCVKQALAFNSAPVRLILVDDATGKEDVEFARLVPSGVEAHIVRNWAKLYFSRCVNRGLRQAVNQWFIVLHPSVEIQTREWVTQIIRPFTMDHSALMVGTDFVGDVAVKPYRLTNRSSKLDRRCVAFRMEGLRYFGGMDTLTPADVHGDLYGLQKRAIQRNWTVWQDDSLRAILRDPCEPEIDGPFMSALQKRETQKTA